jgi:N-acetylneuraminic acid mutarotase
VAAPSPAPATRDAFVVLGGDDGGQLETPPEQHRGFRREMLFYDRRTDHWREIGTMAAPRVTVPCVFWRDLWLVPGGEMRPGIRSPEVWTWRAK